MSVFVIIAFLLGVISLKIQQAVTNFLHAKEKKLRDEQRFQLPPSSKHLQDFASWAIELHVATSFLVSAILFIIGKVSSVY